MNARISGKHTLSSKLTSRKVMVTKEFKFDSCHRLLNYDGKCAYVHGHCWKLQVSILGMVNPDTGIVVDFKNIKKIVNPVIEQMDHNYLNEYLDFNPTCENLVKWLWEVLGEQFALLGLELQELKLWETDTSYATFNGLMARGLL